MEHPMSPAQAGGIWGWDEGPSEAVLRRPGAHVTLVT